ncbi:uncharacterized protein LOC143427213 [Xylocopa sonorina]|uniref:uncharacterized protein LOC143427213 n=1 Tax=Xylocopa sonorina TaxID=1818115 RepID=UPI00403AD07E
MHTYQILKSTENDDVERNAANADEYKYEKFRRCVIMHHEALQSVYQLLKSKITIDEGLIYLYILRFYNVLESSCRNLYLIQMGINMMVISVTAVRIRTYEHRTYGTKFNAIKITDLSLVMYLGRLEQAIRTFVYLGGQQFHLYIISLPGQLLLDQSSKLADTIFASKWYDMPVKTQKMLHIMQIRSNKPCILTAAGLYVMKIESFGLAVKACMSYFTMFLSLME